MSTTIRNYTGRAATAGAPEETYNLSFNGAAAAATQAVPAGTNLFITDVASHGNQITNYRIQQTNDGLTWFDLDIVRHAADGYIARTLKTPIRVIGGANVSIRARIETPGGVAAIGASHLSLKGYSTP